MNVEIGTEAVQFPEKEYKNGVFLAARPLHPFLVQAQKSEKQILNYFPVF
jgi:hypothetical protein